jgi:flagellar biosynthesis GTPase FlhF
MTLQTIPKTFVAGTLQVVRLPIDGALRLFALAGGGESVQLAVDRADATIRAAAGTIFRSESLQEDAERRYAAADAREEALDLHLEAELRSERADRQAAEVERDAEKRRKKAAEEAARKREAAQKRRQATKSEAAKTAEKRKQKAEESAARTKRQANDREQREKLEQLDTKSVALAQKELSLTAADEARRLRSEAAKAKSARKNGS